MTQKLLGAALGAALAFYSPYTYAEKPAKTETYQDIVEKAYNLSLQKDRQQALTILSNALKKEARPVAISEIKKAMDEIGQIFFSDKAQQLYETSVSLRKADLKQALLKINEAARIEPDNFFILTESVRLQIANGDCNGGQSALEKELKLAPHVEELNLALAQVHVCQNNWKEYLPLLDAWGPKKGALGKYWLPLEIERQLFLKSPSRAQEVVAQLQKTDAKYPELPYWEWRVDQALQKKNSEAAHKYVMTCKNISAIQYRQYMIDPMLCRRTSELDSETKGINGHTE